MVVDFFAQTSQNNFTMYRAVEPIASDAYFRIAPESNARALGSIWAFSLQYSVHEQIQNVTRDLAASVSS